MRTRSSYIGKRDLDPTYGKVLESDRTCWKVNRGTPKKEKEKDQQLS